ncbi:pyridoxamine 5'-phosphate oxidase family protein [Nitrospirillum sp. BR 11164]|uniref:pyridoxamine 5'-phosphate oxidase family protein n=1 Tax=Nitrospirillum sp. BR 11164 TaxID=3104324 RepID=UPI002AFF9BD7|nr:pyridoxamine 5'-phosphate oxidase family protein [Nitrospirillum sp. BR 11164]MEA1649704.1 pyridoxamine 5'-phosphate oxidase family protein [Nitrospirillum sp. BR 11164]
MPPDIPPANTPPEAVGTARALLGGRSQATLTTLVTPSAEDAAAVAGWPYPSLVLVAMDWTGNGAGRPLLLLSELALHTRNLRQDGRAALLFEDTAGRENPLTGPRLSVMGRAEALAGEEAEAARAVYLDRHPSAALYADFPDFRFWRMEITQAHLVAGFGRIHWLNAADLTTSG